MKFTVYVVDESLLPGEKDAGTPAASPHAIYAAIRKHGGLWSRVSPSVDQFEDAFKSLDPLIGDEGFLLQLAFRGSPGLLLIDDPEESLLGYFEKSLVPHLHGVFSELAEDVEKIMDAKDAPIEDVQYAFISALEEATSRGFAVAILHRE
jgi:hypothetical protein